MLRPNVLALALKLEGFAVSTALDGTTGISQILEQRPDVVLLDITLPDMSGIDVAVRVRETEVRDIAIIAVTALGFEEDREKYRHVGFDAICTKPVGIRELIQLIHKVTGQK
jgi:DNA-binding response OmpR family regulator